MVLARRQKRNVHPTDSGARKMTTLAAQCVVTNKQLGKKTEDHGSKSTGEPVRRDTHRAVEIFFAWWQYSMLFVT